MRKIQFYKHQGIPIAPGSSRFFIGNLLDLAEMEKAKQRGEQTKQPMAFVFDYFAKLNGDDMFEAHKYPALLTNLNSVISIRISDPYLV